MPPVMLSCQCQEISAANGLILRPGELSLAGKAPWKLIFRPVRPDAAPHEAPVPALHPGVRPGAVKIPMPFYLPFFSVFQMCT